MNGNRLIVLKNEDEDCDNCTQLIKESIKEKRAEIKAKIQQT